MNIARKNIVASITIAGTLLLAGCASKNVDIIDHKFNSNIDGLTLQSKSPSLVYIRKDSKPLSKYRNFFIDPIKVIYSDEMVSKLNKKQVKKLQEYFHKSLSTKLEESGFVVTEVIIPNSMRISFTISGIKAPSAAKNVISAFAPITPSVGEVTVEGTFINADENRIDAVIVNKSQGSQVFNSSPWSTWADIESSFDQWSEGIVKGINR